MSRKFSRLGARTLITLKHSKYMETTHVDCSPNYLCTLRRIIPDIYLAAQLCYHRVHTPFIHHLTSRVTLMFIAPSSATKYLNTYGTAIRTMPLLVSHTRHTAFLGFKSPPTVP